MEKFITIAERLYQQIITQIFGEIPTNEWYTAHLDVIQGATTVVLTGLVLLGVVVLVCAVTRFMAALLGWRK